MTTLEKILRETSAVSVGNGSYKGICPVHDDHDPSLMIKINVDENRLPIFKCWSGCTFQELADYFEAKGLIKSKNELQNNIEKEKILTSEDKIYMKLFFDLKNKIKKQGMENTDEKDIDNFFNYYAYVKENDLERYEK